MRDARAVMHVGIANPRWRGKRSGHSRRMRNPPFTYLVRGPWSDDRCGRLAKTASVARTEDLQCKFPASAPELLFVTKARYICAHISWLRLYFVYFMG